MKKILVLAVVFSLLTASASFAYEVIDVKNGGSIKGKIKASAKVMSCSLSQGTEVCGRVSHKKYLSPGLEECSGHVTC